MTATLAPYSGAVFGRTKTPAAPAAPADESPESAAEEAKTAGKGRPTPTRREAEQAKRRPLIGSSASAKAASQLSQAKTKEERKAAKAAQREALRDDRLRARQALVTGDDAGLPVRDKGPVRRYARDYIDSRRWAGEFVLPVALVVLFGGMLAPQLRLITTGLLYLMIVVVLFDVGRVRAGLRRELTAKFGDKAGKPDVRYGMMRSLQMRRFRLPKPHVQRGQHPS
jgi:DUF3043 family protein